MKVSIIIPVYNAEKYLNECIKSALNQNYEEIEVIAINDGSTDNSLKILENYSDKIRIFSKQNGGTASAFNLGIKNMTGEWFKWLSADDVLYPNAVKELISEAKKTKDTKKIWYGNYDIINSESKIVKQFIEPNYNGLEIFEINSILLDHFVGNGTTSLIHKSAFDKYGMFDEDIGFAEDYELWLRLCVLHNFRLHLVPKILAKYRIHEKQLTKVKLGKSLENSRKIRNMILEKLNPEDRNQYEIALEKIKKNKPLKVRLRRSIRDTMIKKLPKSISDKVLKTYMTKIKRQE
ncbi:glycoprotein 3-alpha-L-fucosyltransferase [Marine Group I thaumarchaeote SCGC RSA3]|uniref:Glycoprotein 3-alpha-L-fucosyltransferase n=2 Tax=Marine Group I TaxID=905826 RepID=A0A087RM32_9ARCH|nr:glycoprotein 3-alpha-L-fucosyltransferase [Marine Group I thaumarchaeote SCGC AAA799-D11]KFM19930.1 glycoprotein 3-alpha-L-fucosyltransferase [Marine Group I thaumarchaeote SCGC RSA3]